MKKCLLTALLCFIAFPAFAGNTDFSNSYDDCMEAMGDYYDKAIDQKNHALAAWFSSFAMDHKAIFKGDTATFIGGCGYIGSDQKGQQLWLKIQSKLNQQIAQLQSGQPSLYGDAAKLVCKWDDQNRKIDFNSCQ